jgi:hypothetical protein
MIPNEWSFGYEMLIFKHVRYEVYMCAQSVSNDKWTTSGTSEEKIKVKIELKGGEPAPRGGGTE